MPVQPTVIPVVADDRYWSETLKQEVYTYKCPRCGATGVVPQIDEVVQCSCSAFLRVTERPAG